MPLPSTASKANCDASTDDPKLAILTDLADLIDKFNLLLVAVQPLDTTLTDLSGSGISATQAGNLATLSTFIATLLNDADQGAALTTLGALLNGMSSKTAAYTVLSTDRGKAIDFSSLAANVDCTLPAVSVGAGFCGAVRNSDSTYTVTLKAAATIDGVAGATGIALAPGESCFYGTNGTVWKTVARTVALPAATASIDGYMTHLYASKLDGIAAGANVGITADVGAAGVGSFSLMYTTTTVASNGTSAGSSLQYPSGSLSPGATASGTWRNIGSASVGGGGAEWGTFQRIA